MHNNSLLLFKKYCLDMFKDNMRVLEIGPGWSPSPYNRTVNNSTIQWDTIDIDPTAKTTYVSSSAYSFPVPDNSYDIVFSGQVIEHVPEIWTWIKELSRVCRPGGWVITIGPVNWPYHEAPHDCWRIYPSGMRSLYKEGGLETILCKRESLDRPPRKELLILTLKEMFKTPKNFIRRVVCRIKDFREWLAEDIITIGKKL